MILQLNQPNTKVNQSVNFIMGNTVTSHPSTDLFYTFKEIKKDHQGTILQHQNSQLTYLLKQYTFTDDLHYERQRERLEKESENNLCQFVLGVYKVKTHTLQGLCSSTHKIYAIYQYPQVNLQDQIMARSKEGKRFDENELWSILQSCNTALGYLKSTASLNSQLVFITQEGQLKVIHNDLIDQNYRFSYDPSYFYAPEKMFQFNRLDSEASLTKQTVFSMAVTVLQAALLVQKVSCYDYQKFLFNEVNLQLMLQSLQGTYSSDLIEMLTLLLSVDPSKRPDTQQIGKLLDNYWNNVDETEQNSENRKYLVNSVEERGIIKNLVTINSQQKESNKKDTSSGSKRLPIDRISQSIEYQSPQCRPPLPASQQSCKQNLYTDPKLLQMIRRDMHDINKLKQSTLKQTIKYSFLYPESDSIFKSIQDVKLSIKDRGSRSNKRQQPLEESDGNQIIPNQFVGRAQLKQQPSVQKQSDYCKTVDAEGYEYEGYMVDGKKQGRGKLIFSDGAFYEGEFQNDQMNGKGTLFYRQNHPAYDGMWTDGQFHGHGILYNESPQILEGPFDYKDFDEVEVYWLKYQGEFVGDTKCGAGCLQLTNGQKIEGTFQNDMIHGDCLYHGLDGARLNGVWEMNRLVHIYQ